MKENKDVFAKELGISKVCSHDAKPYPRQELYIKYKMNYICKYTERKGSKF